MKASLSLDIIYGGLGKVIAIFDKKNIFYKFSTVNFSQFLAIKNLETYENIKRFEQRNVVFEERVPIPFKVYKARGQAGRKGVADRTGEAGRAG
jgi:hypothetical protein